MGVRKARPYAGPRLQLIMRVAFLTGQRIGDVLTIRRSQLTCGC